MFKRLIAVGIILLFLLSSIIPISSSYEVSSNNIIYVDDDGTADYIRIQDAIDYTTDADTKSVDATGENYSFSVEVNQRIWRYWFLTPRHIFWKVDICNADDATISIPDGRLYYELWVEEEDLYTGDIKIHPMGTSTLFQINISDCVEMEVEHRAHYYDTKYTCYCKVTDLWTKEVKESSWDVTISTELRFFLKSIIRQIFFELKSSDYTK
jgi:hypothetical protein